MFGKFFNRPAKVESGPKPLIPDFIENPELQNAVKECADAWRLAYAYTHDGQLEEAKKHNEEVDRLLKENGDEMRTYLQPYIALDSEKLRGYATGPENDRKQVAAMIMALDKNK